VTLKLWQQPMGGHISMIKVQDGPEFKGIYQAI
jgi:hypothetical protein